MKPGRLLIACAGALLLALPPASFAEKLQTLAPTRPAPANERRVALVIGNGAYKASPLRNPVNDARAIAKSLAGTGFAVTLVEEATQIGMRRAIRNFGDELARGGVGLFYFAGHGMQVRGRNYLIPVNADIEREDEVEDQAVDANLVMAKMDSAKNSLNLMILDACRNNPFARSFRSATQGLAQMDAPSGTLISFATAPGSVAADGEGANGVYTRHLLTAIAQPGLPVEQLFKQVRIGVTKDTGDRQVPWESSSLKGDFYFLPPDPNAGTAVQKAAIDKAVGDAVRVEQEKAARERAELQGQLKKLVEEMLAKQKSELDAELKKRGAAEAVAAAVPRPAAPAPAAPPAAAPAPAPVQIAAAAPAAALIAGQRAGMPREGDAWQYAGKLSNGQPLGIRARVKGVLDGSILEARAGGGSSGGEDWVHTPGAQVVGGRGGAAVFNFSPYLLAFQDLKVGDAWSKIPFQQVGDCSIDPTVYCEFNGKVMAFEKVSVAAGTFDAYRIEIEQLYMKDRGVSIRKATFWYSPAAKRHVKVTWKLLSGGFRGPDAEAELVSYKLN